MQKIFTKYISCVVAIALLAVLGFNWFFQEYNARIQMVKNSVQKLDQLSQMIERNEVELQNLKERLNEDYLTRAYAFAYIIKQNPEVLNSQEELDHISELLSVDELHVIDENGILYAGNMPMYLGMDFHAADQTREFLDILDDPDTYLVRGIRPNGYEKKLFQYIGVARLDKKGIVQVGIAPDRILEAQKRNRLENILDGTPVDEGSTLFVIRGDDGKILAHTNSDLQQKNLESLGVEIDELSEYREGKFAEYNEKKIYYVIRQYGDRLLGIGQEAEQLYRQRNHQILLTALYLIVVCIVMIAMIRQLLKRQIVNGIHTIMGELEEITEGNLNTVVKVENNPEFKQLSRGINQMVQGILDATVKVYRVIDNVDMPIGVFELGENKDRVSTTGRLGAILGWTEEQTQKICHDKWFFMKKLDEIRRDPEEGEKDIYKISEHPVQWVKIQMTSEKGGTFGVVTDVTKEMLEKKKIQHERDYDFLTGLSKMDIFGREVTSLMERGDMEESAMVMLDLDEFKGINDNYGHDWGDEYLRICASFFKEMEGKQCAAARRSGDEFCMFLHHFDSKAELRNCMEQFYDAIQKREITFPDGSLRILRISSGIAWYKGTLNTYSALLKAADYALYEAKNSGKGIMKEYSLE